MGLPSSNAAAVAPVVTPNQRPPGNDRVDTVSGQPMGVDAPTGPIFSPRQWALGVDASQQSQAGSNPPSWAVDESTWEAAKAAAGRSYAPGDDSYWPAVVSIYQNMGGKTSKQAIEFKDADAPHYKLSDGAIESAMPTLDPTSLICRYEDGSSLSWVKLFPLDTKVYYEGSPITFDDEFLSTIKKNFDAVLNADYDHMSDPNLAAPPEVKKSAGQVWQLDNRSDGLWAMVHWTPAASEAIRNREWNRISPEFATQWTDKYSGEEVGPKLRAVGLVNRPFLEHDMPAVSASEKQDYATVNGVTVGKGDFAYAPAGSNPSDWKLPVHDAAHVRAALARYNQVQGIPPDAKAAVKAKLLAAARKFGVTVADDSTVKQDDKPGFASTMADRGPLQPEGPAPADLTPLHQLLGTDARAQQLKGQDPDWAADKAKWEKAEKDASADYEVENPLYWACVARYYLQAGGSIVPNSRKPGDDGENKDAERAETQSNFGSRFGESGDKKNGRDSLGNSNARNVRFAPNGNSSRRNTLMAGKQPGAPTGSFTRTMSRYHGMDDDGMSDIAARAIGKKYAGLDDAAMDEMDAMDDVAAMDLLQSAYAKRSGQGGAQGQFPKGAGTTGATGTESNTAKSDDAAGMDDMDDAALDDALDDAMSDMDDAAMKDRVKGAVKGIFSAQLKEGKKVKMSELPKAIVRVSSQLAKENDKVVKTNGDALTRLTEANKTLSEQLKTQGAEIKTLAERNKKLDEDARLQKAIRFAEKLRDGDGTGKGKKILPAQFDDVRDQFLAAEEFTTKFFEKAPDILAPTEDRSKEPNDGKPPTESQIAADENFSAEERIGELIAVKMHEKENSPEMKKAKLEAMREGKREPIYSTEDAKREVREQYPDLWAKFNDDQKAKMEAEGSRGAIRRFNERRPGRAPRAAAR